MDHERSNAPLALEEKSELLANLNQPESMTNLLKVMAHSPSAFTAYAHMQNLNQHGSLDKLTKQRIALTLAQLNQCQYSLSLHTKLAREAGLNSSEIDSNRAGTSQDAKGAVAVQFARILATEKGKVTNEQWQDIRHAGYSDSDIIEIITHVGMNTLSNLLAKACDLEIDSPVISLDQTHEATNNSAVKAPVIQQP